MALLSLAVLVVAGGVALATIPDSQGQIHGCYQKGNGGLRVVDSAADCRSSEIAIQWNEKGPTGATGPIGATGPQGPPGSGSGNTVAFDEKTSEVTTSSTTPVDLGGPSVTVTVGPGGLVEVFARAELSSPGAGIAEVSIFEPTDLNPAELILGACCDNLRRQWTTLARTGTGDRFEATWHLYEVTPGVRTFSLRYRDRDNAGVGTGHFRNRKLWVVPVG